MRNSSILLAIAIAFTGVSGCKQRATPSEEEPADTSTYRAEQTPATEFEQKLKLVRDGHFSHIWVFTRKDSRAFTS